MDSSIKPYKTNSLYDFIDILTVLLDTAMLCSADGIAVINRIIWQNRFAYAIDDMFIVTAIAIVKLSHTHKKKKKKPGNFVFKHVLFRNNYFNYICCSSHGQRSTSENLSNICVGTAIYHT